MQRLLFCVLIGCSCAPAALAGPIAFLDAHREVVVFADTTPSGTSQNTARTVNTTFGEWGALHTAYIWALVTGVLGPVDQMILALAAYAAYVINAAQFLLKLRAARLQAAAIDSGVAA
jgi:hypothetical protein